MKGPWLARIAIAFAVVVAMLALVTARAVRDGEAALRLADASLRARDPMAAVVHAREAASWYVPGAPHVPAAYARLVHVARTAEAEGNPDTALFAWRAVRTAAIDSRWLLQPHAHDLEVANAAIARMASAEPNRGIAPPSIAPEQAERLTRAVLAEPEGARAPYLAVLAAGLATMLAGAAWTVARRGRKQPVEASLAVVALGAALYVVAALLA